MCVCALCCWRMNPHQLNRIENTCAVWWYMVSTISNIETFSWNWTEVANDQLNRFKLEKSHKSLETEIHLATTIFASLLEIQILSMEKVQSHFLDILLQWDFSFIRVQKRKHCLNWQSNCDFLALNLFSVAGFF